MTAKANYVRNQKADDPSHRCHWPGCEKIVPPAMWGCKKHWFKLPKRLRDRIWSNFTPGQEIDKSPSEEYLAAAQEVQEWIARDIEGNKPDYSDAAFQAGPYVYGDGK